MTRISGIGCEKLGLAPSPAKFRADLVLGAWREADAYRCFGGAVVSRRRFAGPRAAAGRRGARIDSAAARASRSRIRMRARAWASSLLPIRMGSGDETTLLRPGRPSAEPG